MQQLGFGCVLRLILEGCDDIVFFLFANILWRVEMSDSIKKLYAWKVQKHAINAGCTCSFSKTGFYYEAIDEYFTSVVAKESKNETQF